MLLIAFLFLVAKTIKFIWIYLWFRFLSKDGMHIPRIKLQLVGVTAMLIASKVCYKRASPTFTSNLYLYHCANQAWQFICIILKIFIVWRTALQQKKILRNFLWQNLVF